MCGVAAWITFASDVFVNSYFTNVRYGNTVLSCVDCAVICSISAYIEIHLLYIMADNMAKLSIDAVFGVDSYKACRSAYSTGYT